MISLGNSIDYLSIQGLPWVLAAWVGLILLRPFATFVHEVGHIIPALLFTKQEVFIRIGQSGSKWNGKIGNIIVGWQIFGNHHPIWIEVLLVSWFCTNALVFIRSVIPLRLKPTNSFPEGPPSDGLELKNLFFK
jgi:hypothetical protein